MMRAPWAEAKAKRLSILVQCTSTGMARVIAGTRHQHGPIRGTRHRHVDIVRTIELSKKIDEPKWHEAMSEMLPDEKIVPRSWTDRWVNIEPPPPVVSRWVDIAQVTPASHHQTQPRAESRAARCGIGIGVCRHGTDACDRRSSASHAERIRKIGRRHNERSYRPNDLSVSGSD